MKFYVTESRFHIGIRLHRTLHPSFLHQNHHPLSSLACEEQMSHRMSLNVISQWHIVDATVKAAQQQKIDPPQRLARRDGCLWNGGDTVVYKRDTTESTHRLQTMLQRPERI